MAAESVQYGSVCSYSVYDPLMKLCRSTLLYSLDHEHSFTDSDYVCLEKSNRTSFSLPWTRLNRLCRKLRACSLDLILLRPWEWLPGEDEEQGTPLSRCMGQAFSLHMQNNSEKAHNLMHCLTLLHGKQSGLSCVDGILQFLYLLSSLDCSEYEEPVRQYIPKDCMYPIYSRDVFEAPSTHMVDTGVISTASKLFVSPPGSGFKGFMSSHDRGSLDASQGEGALFGALVRSTSAGVNDHLGLPALPSDHTHISLLPHKVQGSSPWPPLIPNAPHSPPPPSSLEPQEQKFSLLREGLSSTGPPRFRGWEGWLSNHSFLCDASPPVTHHLAHLLTSKYARLAGLGTGEGTLQAWVEEPGHFLEDLLQQVDEVAYTSSHAGLEADHVLFSISRCLQSLLVSCRTKMLVLADTKVSLLQKDYCTHFMMPVAMFVLDLMQSLPQMEKFAVLECLYQQCSRLQGTSHYLLFLGLLNQALLSYFRYVELWVFQGHMDTQHQFYGIVFNGAALAQRDESYWSEGFLAPDGCTPTFLSHLNDPILSCGKALNLLRHCQPEHALCTGTHVGPSLRLRFSSQRLAELELQCASYQAIMTSINLALTEQLQQERLEKEEKEKALLVRARQEARRASDALKKLENERLRADAKRKRSLALELKKDMEDMQAVRSRQLAEEMQADKELIAAMNKENQTLRQQEALLEKEARLALEQYYKDLSEEAEQRKARVEWRLARLKLSAAREDLWRMETHMLWEEAGKDDLGTSLAQVSASHEDGAEVEKCKEEEKRSMKAISGGKLGETSVSQQEGNLSVEPKPLGTGVENLQRIDQEEMKETSLALSLSTDLQVENQGTSPHHQHMQDEDRVDEEYNVLICRGTPPPATIRPVPHEEDRPPPATIQPVLHEEDMPPTATIQPVPHEEDMPPPATIQPVLHEEDMPPPATIQPVLHEEDMPPPATIQPVLHEEGRPPPATIQPVPHEEGRPPPATIQPVPHEEDMPPPATIQPVPHEEDMPPPATIQPVPHEEDMPPPATIQPVPHEEDMPPPATIQPVPHEEDMPPPATIQPVLHEEGRPPPATIQPVPHEEDRPPPATIQPVLHEEDSPPPATIQPVPHEEGRPPPATFQPVPHEEDMPPPATIQPVLHEEDMPPPATIQPVLHEEDMPPPATIQPVLHEEDMPPLATIQPVLHEEGRPPPATIQPVPHEEGQDDPDSHLTSTASTTHLKQEEGHLLQDESQGVPHQVTSRGFPPPSTIGHLLQDVGQGDPHQVTTRGFPPPSTIGHLLQDKGQGDPHQVTTRGFPPPSTIGHLQDVGQGDPHQVTTRGFPPPSTIGHLLQDVGQGDPHQVTTRGFPPPSTIGHLLQDVGQGDPHQVTTRGFPPPSTIGHLLQDVGQGDPHQVTTRGFPPPSTIGHLLQDVGQGDPHQVTSRGFPPPSTIQKLMYPKEVELSVKESSSEFTDLPLDVEITSAFKYPDQFPRLENAPTCEMGTTLLGEVCFTSSAGIDEQFLSVHPIQALLVNSIELPLHTQCRLVQRALLDHFLSNCQLRLHFLTLKRFLLLEDGEFGHALCTQLCQELCHGCDWKMLYSPSFLSDLLSSSLEASFHNDSMHTSRLTFSLKCGPKPIHPYAIKALDFLELKYKVDWPCNIIITDTSIQNYNKILHFLLEMKRSVWVLSHTFHTLKECRVLEELQVRQLQIIRHEFQHFINTMHGYIASQLFGHTWAEFQKEVSEQVQCLDGMIQAHHKFVDKALFRCLLSKKAMPVMNLICELLSSILTFCSQASSIASSPAHCHQMMVHTHRDFRDTAQLLIRVLSKLVARGYQPHLEELLLRLNFNKFYYSM